MSQTNTLSATMPDADKQAILQQIQQVKQQLGNVLLFNLTPEERQGVLKMGDKTVAFVDKALAYAQQNPNLVPPFISVDEAAKDLHLASQLSDIARELAVLTTALDDTLIVAGSEAYDAALQFYGSVRAASRSNAPGSQAIYEDLSKRFPGRPKRPAAAKTA